MWYPTMYTMRCSRHVRACSRTFAPRSRTFAHIRAGLYFVAYDIGATFQGSVAIQCGSVALKHPGFHVCIYTCHQVV